LGPQETASSLVAWFKEQGSKEREEALGTLLRGGNRVNGGGGRPLKGWKRRKGRRS